MGYGIRLHVWGDYACFTRPEFKAERVSYDVPTPSAARGIIEAVYWKPEIRWVIDRIRVLRPIRFQGMRRNEVGSKASSKNAAAAMKTGDLSKIGIVSDDPSMRVQRASNILVDVSYVIEAHFELTRGQGADTAAKHQSIFNRRAAAGQCFHRPCLGTREFDAQFALLREGEVLPESRLPPEQANRELGWMLHDIDFDNGCTPHFFRASLRGGVLDVRACLDEHGMAS